ncbi:MAG: S8 family serine peptidase [Chloroflexota bacterium]
MAILTGAFRLPLLLLVLLATLNSMGASENSTAQGPATGWEEKVAPGLLREVETQGEAEFIVFMREQADLSGAERHADKEAKGAYVYGRLTELARQTQEQLLEKLLVAGAEHHAFWIANMIWVRGDEEVLEMMASSAQVSAVFDNPRWSLDPIDTAAPQQETPATVEPNITKIEAPDVWALGATGQGVVIGGQDTGYDWQHPALRDKYRGWDGVSADHNYNWHDAVHTGGGICDADVLEPCDDNGHGTHTMGTMVGDDGGANQIGVAPDAKWIGCRNMDQGNGTPSTYAECFEWFLAPTDLNDENPNPALAPHVINNSWACPPSENCKEPTILQAVVENVRAAGIVVVSSAGNRGPDCGTVQYPPAIYEATLSVGAVSNDDVIAGFSSRGPVTVDGSNRLKPDVVAPGVNVRSSFPGGACGTLSGTSMAAPHVAGLVALLISANPALSGNVAALEAAIMHSAVPLTSQQTCGAVSGDSIPNHTFGYGRISALSAYNDANSLHWYYAPTMFVTR